MERKVKEHKGMIDNRMVKDDHQEGISRKTQRPGDMETGQPGKMGKGSEAHWKRSGGSMTPRRA